jgi:hypothetical protein
VCASETDLSISIREICRYLTALLRSQPSKVPEIAFHQDTLADICACASQNPERANIELRALLQSLRSVVGEKVEKFVLPELVEEYLNCKDLTKAIHKAAYHEAGHVLVAAKCRVEIGRSIGMCIDLFGRGNSEMRLRYPGDSPDYPVSREDSIVVLFAGRIAEMQFDPLTEGRSASCDLGRIKELQDEAPSNTVLNGLEDQSRTLVKEGWRSIEQLATELLSRPYEDRRESEGWSKCEVARYLCGEKISEILGLSGIAVRLKGAGVAD